MMPLNRSLPMVLAFALGGCGSIGAIGLPPQGQNQPPPSQVAGGLPPPTETYPAPPPGGAVIAEPLPPAGGTAVAGVEPLPTPPPASGSIGRTDLLGGWTIAASGDSCQLFMTLTSWTGGYRASTRGCSSAELKSISAWNLQGSQVVLAGQGGTPVATLQSAGGTRFDGTTATGGPVSFYR
jgi:predicted small lipoprotein YifL